MIGRLWRRLERAMDRQRVEPQEDPAHEQLEERVTRSERAMAEIEARADLMLRQRQRRQAGR